MFFFSFFEYSTVHGNLKQNYVLMDELRQLAESDIAKQASIAAANVAKGAQSGAKNAAEGFNRFVEGQDNAAARRQAPIDESKKDFWDSFADAGRERQAGGSSAIGTSAVKKSGKKEEDGWEKW